MQLCIMQIVFLGGNEGVILLSACWVFTICIDKTPAGLTVCKNISANTFFFDEDHLPHDHFTFRKPEKRGNCFFWHPAI